MICLGTNAAVTGNGCPRLRWQRLGGFLIPMVIGSSMFGCGDRTGPPTLPPPPPPDQQTIGPSGGSLRSRDNSVVVEVPPGAVSQPTVMRLVLDSTPIITDTALGQQLGPVINLSPEGMTFSQPVTISVKLPPGVPNAEAALLSPFDPTLGMVFWQPTWVDAVGGRISTATDHFSTWVPWWSKPITSLPQGSYTYSLANCPSQLGGTGSTCADVVDDVNRGVGFWLPLLRKSGIDILPGRFRFGPEHIEIRFLAHSLILNPFGPYAVAAWSVAVNRVILINDNVGWYPTQAEAIANSTAPGHLNIERAVAHELGHHIGLYHIGVPLTWYRGPTPCDPASPGVTSVMGYAHLGLPLPLSSDDLRCIALALPSSTGSPASVMVADPPWPGGITVAPNSPISPRPSVRVTSASQKGIEGVTVVFEVTLGGGTTQGRVATTDSHGVATVPGWTAGPTGLQRLTAYVHGTSPPTLPFDVALTVNPQAGFLATGDTHTCSLAAQGQVYCWGWNGSGELGDGTTIARLTPTPVAGTDRFVSVALSSWIASPGLSGPHSCAVSLAGRLLCWGNNQLGQLGDGGTAFSRTTPTAVAGNPQATWVTAGGSHTCALTPLRQALCWGLNHYGQLGDGTTTNRNMPTAVFGPQQFTTITAAGWHTCGLDTQGLAWCWGANLDGQLGDGIPGPGTAPSPVAGNHRFTSIDAGNGHTCGVTGQGQAYCWGANSNGQLGDGTTLTRTIPTPAAGSLRFVAITAGGFHSCGLMAQGQAYCWGHNGYGQIGDGRTTAQPAPPTLVSGGLTLASLAAGHLYTCGITTQGDAYCWGYGAHGQLGDGTTTLSRSVPTRVIWPPTPTPTASGVR
jgi:alpha-tubulin suppressor-like RCC1 family protein